VVQNVGQCSGEDEWPFSWQTCDHIAWSRFNSHLCHNTLLHPWIRCSAWWLWTSSKLTITISAWWLWKSSKLTGKKSKKQPETPQYVRIRSKAQHCCRDRKIKNWFVCSIFILLRERDDGAIFWTNPHLPRNCPFPSLLVVSLTSYHWICCLFEITKHR